MIYVSNFHKAISRVKGKYLGRRKQFWKDCSPSIHLEVSVDKMKKCILSERRFLGRAVVVRQFSVKRLCLNKDYSSWSEDLGRY